MVNKEGIQPPKYFLLKSSGGKVFKIEIDDAGSFTKKELTQAELKKLIGG